jgi:hypothetical protein
VATISTSRVKALLKKAGAPKIKAATKGALLEELGRYVFERVPKIKFAGRDILDVHSAHEIDLAFLPRPGCELSFLGYPFIVECKHTRTPVPSHQIGWLVTKLHSSGIQNAVVITPEGITGSAERGTSAYREVLDALTAYGIRVLIINKVELLSLTTTAKLVTLLETKLLALSLRRSVV